MKRILNTLLILILLSIPGTPQEKNVNPIIFTPGESLVYKVKWTFFRLGTIIIKTRASAEGPGYVIVSMQVKSNPDLFFLNVEEYNETVVEIANCMSKSYYGEFRDGSDRKKIYSEYSNKTGAAYYKVVDDVGKKTLQSDTIYNASRYVDGPSLFFFTRTHARDRKSYNVPNMVNGKIENTRISYPNETEMVEVDAFPHPVKARRFMGFADWEGGTSQGLSGEFSGWVADDESSLILYAEVSVLLGKLKIELEYQNRLKPENNYHTSK